MAQAVSLASSQKAQRPVQGLRVLVFDPNATNRVRLKDTLRGIDIVDSVSETSRLSSAVDHLKDNPVNLLIIDEEATEKDVFEVIKQVRDQPAAAKTRIMLFADEITQEMKTKGAEVGVAAYLSRPYNTAGLEATLKAAMKPAGPAPGSAAAQHRQDFLDRLRTLSLFQRFSNEELARLMKICKAYRVGPGTHVFREGEEGHSLFVLVAGQVNIVKENAGQQQVLVSMNPGDVFGEMAIVDAEPRFAAAVAANDCSVIEISASIVNNNDDVISLKLVRAIAILLVKKLRLLSK